MKPNACHMPQPARRSEAQIEAYRDNAGRQITGLDHVPEILALGQVEGRILVAQAQAIQAQDSANKREYGGRSVPGATSEAAQHAYDRKSGAKRYQIRAKIPKARERLSYRSPIDDSASIAEDVQYGSVAVPDRLGNIVVAVANNAVPQTVIRTQHLGRSLLRDGGLGRAA